MCLIETFESVKIAEHYGISSIKQLKIFLNICVFLKEGCSPTVSELANAGSKDRDYKSVLSIVNKLGEGSNARGRDGLFLIKYKDFGLCRRLVLTEKGTGLLNQLNGVNV